MNLVPAASPEYEVRKHKLLLILVDKGDSRFFPGTVSAVIMG